MVLVVILGANEACSSLDDGYMRVYDRRRAQRGEGALTSKVRHSGCTRTLSVPHEVHREQSEYKRPFRDHAEDQKKANIAF
jgi:hypothetical protein